MSQESSPMRLFLLREGKESGPFQFGEIMERLRAGSFALDDICWIEGTSSRAPLRVTLPKLAPPLPTSANHPVELQRAPAHIVSTPTLVSRLPSAKEAVSPNVATRADATSSSPDQQDLRYQYPPPPRVPADPTKNLTPQTPASSQAPSSGPVTRQAIQPNPWEEKVVIKQVAPPPPAAVRIWTAEPGPPNGGRRAMLGWIVAAVFFIAFCIVLVVQLRSPTAQRQANSEIPAPPTVSSATPAPGISPAGLPNGAPLPTSSVIAEPKSTPMTGATENSVAADASTGPTPSPYARIARATRQKLPQDRRQFRMRRIRRLPWNPSRARIHFQENDSPEQD